MQNSKAGARLSPLIAAHTAPIYATDPIEYLQKLIAKAVATKQYGAERLFRSKAEALEKEASKWTK